MSPLQAKVREFCAAMGQPAPDRYTPLDEQQRRLRARLIVEEALEFAIACGLAVVVDRVVDDGRQSFWFDRGQALTGVPATLAELAPDEAAQVDAIADLLYVTLGAAVTMGLDIAPFFAAVHEANMKKAGGPISAEGKRLKPPGWRPPPIAEMLAGLKAREGEADRLLGDEREGGAK